MPDSSPLLDTLPEAFRLRQAQLSQERQDLEQAQRQRAQAEAQLQQEHNQILRYLLESLEAFLTLGPCDALGNRLWVSVFPSEDRYTLIDGYFAEDFEGYTRLPVFSIIVMDNLLALKDKLHLEPVDVEDTESLLDVIYLRIADYTADFLGPLPEPEPSDDLANDQLPEKLDTLQDKSDNRPEGDVSEVQTVQDSDQTCTLALLAVSVLGSVTENDLSLQLSEFCDDSKMLMDYEILPADTSFLVVDPLDKNTPREAFRLLIGIEGTHSQSDMEALLLPPITSGLLPLENPEVLELVHREEPAYLLRAMLSDIADRIRSGA